MAKKYFNWPVISAVLVTIIFMMNFKATAYMDGGSSEGTFNTDKTDRMLIKEIHAGQKETLALLKEIKSALRASK